MTEGSIHDDTILLPLLLAYCGLLALLHLLVIVHGAL